jgi:hypothetical protein
MLRIFTGNLATYEILKSEITKKESSIIQPRLLIVYVSRKHVTNSRQINLNGIIRFKYFMAKLHKNL